MKTGLFFQIWVGLVLLGLLSGSGRASLVVNNNTKTQQTQSYRDCINGCSVEFRDSPLLRTCFDSCIHRPLQF